ncbi:hypothetical protein CASFOL_026275 [Castilleja foliolosa]|uniref:Uncharacterized protein n=1 Tax=Castilleja foliolosa TaxID=1961234 RepID=A0ABD3CJ71_9LAMI
MGVRAFEQAHVGAPPGLVFDSSLRPDDIDQLPIFWSSPSKHSSPQQNVSENSKLPVTQDDGCDTNLERATDVELTDPAPQKLKQQQNLLKLVS